MTTEKLFIVGVFSIIAIGIVALAMMTPPRIMKMPTEAEMVMIERMAKVAAMVQGECK